MDFSQRFWSTGVTETATPMSHLKQLASLLARLNTIDEEIAALIGRPAGRGSVGEWIAQEIFKVKLAKTRIRGASTAGLQTVRWPERR